jgi:hypothetical protein
VTEIGDGISLEYALKAIVQGYGLDGKRKATQAARLVRGHTTSLGSWVGFAVRRNRQGTLARQGLRAGAVLLAAVPAGLGWSGGNSEGVPPVTRWSVR